MAKKKVKTETELDKKCKAALTRINKHIEKLVNRHLQEMGLVVQDKN
jgi:hypothetical protein